MQGVFGGGTTDVFVSKIKDAESGLSISGASLKGKKLLVTGSGFAVGAVILLNGEKQKTANDEQNPQTLLIAKKAGKQIAPGQTVVLQVRNADGALSKEFSFTRE